MIISCLLKVIWNALYNHYLCAPVAMGAWVFNVVKIVFSGYLACPVPMAIGIGLGG